MIDRVAVEVLAEAKREVLVTEEKETEKCIPQPVPPVAKSARCHFSLTVVSRCIVRIVLKKVRVILVKRDRNLEESGILLSQKLIKINRTTCWFQLTPSWKEF